MDILRSMARRDHDNRSTYRSDSEIPGVSVLSADFATQEYAPHSHQALVVATTDAGAADITSRGTTEAATTAELFVFNPAEPHSTRMSGSRRWRFRSIYVTERGLTHIAAQLDMPRLGYFTRNALRDADLIAAFRAAQSALFERAERFQRQEMLTLAFGGLFKRHGGRTPGPGPVRDEALMKRVAAQMRDGHAETLQLEALAESAGLSVWQLIGLFKRTSGLTPHAYLTQIRLSAACRHLRRGHAIAETAIAAGFCDQSALTKHFKRSYGMTPRQFAAASQR